MENARPFRDMMASQIVLTANSAAPLPKAVAVRPPAAVDDDATRAALCLALTGLPLGALMDSASDGKRPPHYSPAVEAAAKKWLRSS
jgi:hypothetical protein